MRVSAAGALMPAMGKGAEDGFLGDANRVWDFPCGLPVQESDGEGGVAGRWVVRFQVNTTLIVGPDVPCTYR